ncbi:MULTISPECIES: hypothetical protein [Serratia]|jgi:hypothetical protein|uniref:hypothetical protein n=1 Tax=Serratia TaxID=613 RepID=UPI00093FF4BE|nr:MULTISPECIES: hypothetical protein [Serratia]OKP30030.1 hypothetical protein BSQ40_05940 [Serratia fonticola]
MQVAETHYLDNTFTFNIPPAPYRRRIAVPLIMATALGKDSKASHRLIFNGVSVAYVEANAGRINVVTGVSSFPPSGVMPSYSNFYLPETDCDSWFGVIEANQAASIKAEASTSNGGKTPKHITVHLGV